jgi:hypothetical protein
MGKILNLEQLSTKSVRSVKIAGTEYPIPEMTVDLFIETTKAAEDMKEASFSDQLELTIKLILASIPGVTRDMLLTLNLDQLQALAAFIRGADPEKLIAAYADAVDADAAPAAESAESGASSTEGGEAGK